MKLRQEVDQLINGYFKWLQDNTELREIDDVVVITTPNLDRHNDCLDIVVSRSEDGTYRLSDDGWTIDDLRASGCVLNTDRRKYFINTTLNGFGVGIGDGNSEIFTTATKENFAQKKHNLIQAMLAINDIFYTVSPKIKSFFPEEVKDWLIENKVRFTPTVKLSGKTGYDHNVDFVVPGFQETPERMLKTINNPDKNSAINFIGIWEDIKGTREADIQAYVLLNDDGKNISHNVYEAFYNYGIKSVAWSSRNDVIEELAV